MNAETAATKNVYQCITAVSGAIAKNGLELLRQPFPAHQISKLPKPTKAQTDAVKADFKAGVRCRVCGSWHHKDVVHLDYVGHAALTDRLLDADPAWTWDPIADPASLGLPTSPGGMWIRLTVCGVSRLGFGHPDGKTGGDAVKEVIGDALRNAAMRFGAALDLWHKGQLHVDEDADDDRPAPPAPQQPAVVKPDGYDAWLAALEATATVGTRELESAWKASALPLRRFLTIDNPKRWEELKEKAAGTKPVDGEVAE